MKALLTLRRDRKEWILTERDPLRLLGSDDMVQGRHARKVLVIFTVLTTSRPRSNVWGGVRVWWRGRLRRRVRYGGLAEGSTQNVDRLDPLAFGSYAKQKSA